MPYKRGNVFYVKRRLPGLGRTYKTLGTGSANRARELESMILKLCERGHLEPIQAWLDDRLSVQELADAFDGGRMPQLMRSLRTKSVPLAEALDQCLTSGGPM